METPTNDHISVENRAIDEPEKVVVRNAENKEDMTVYPTGIKLGMIFLSLCLAVFLTALDNTIIATAIPRITDQFHSQDDIGWYGSAYLLTQCSFQLLFGKLYSYLSIKWIFLIAMSIFELGSLICGVAPNSVALIVGRAIAGIGSAGISSGAIIIISHAVPLQMRPMCTGLTGAMYGIASVAGPLLGGAFTDEVTWRWCFYINLPVGAVAIGVNLLFFKPPPRHRNDNLGWKKRLSQFDLPGTTVFVPAVICLLLALQWGGTAYAWSNWRIILLLTLTGVFVVVWFGIQIWQKEQATVPLRLFKSRSIAGASWFAFTLGSFFFILLYYLPIWFQAVKGVSAVRSGIMSLPLILVLTIVSILSGVGVTIVGSYAPFMILTSICSSIGAGLLLTFTPYTGSPAWIGYQALIGIGIGAGVQQPLIVVQNVCTLSDIPVGTSLMYFLQTVGGAIFISVGQNVFANHLAQELARLLPSLDPGIVLNTGAIAIQSAVSPEEEPLVVLAYNNALVQCFMVATIMACLTILGALPVKWLNMKENVANKKEDPDVTASKPKSAMEQNDDVGGDLKESDESRGGSNKAEYDFPDG